MRTFSTNPCMWLKPRAHGGHALSYARTEVGVFISRVGLAHVNWWLKLRGTDILGELMYTGSC